MKRILGFLVLAMAVMPGRWGFAQDGLTKIADNVYACVDVRNSMPSNSFGANAGVVVGSRGIAVIDTLISAKEAKRLLADIRAISDKPVRYVVDTHSHLDHTFGNSLFEKAGAVVVSQEATKREMLAGSEKTLAAAKDFGLTAQDMEGTVIAYPELTFGDRMRIDLGGVEVELMYPGPSHTDGSILVFLPGRKILFAGDVLFTNYHPYMADGNIDGWVKTLDFVLSLDAETIVPGHGPVSTKRDVREMKEYVVTFDRKARELAAKSGDVKAIAAALKESLPPRAQGEWMIPANVEGKYLGKGR